jgi:hypothetical protein
VLVLIDKLLVVWTNGMIGYPPLDGWFLLPLLSSLLSWPLIFIILSDLSRTYHVD